MAPGISFSIMKRLGCPGTGFILIFLVILLTVLIVVPITGATGAVGTEAAGLVGAIVLIILELSPPEVDPPSKTASAPSDNTLLIISSVIFLLLNSVLASPFFIQARQYPHFNSGFPQV